jgi:hypothetical protein
MGFQERRAVIVRLHRVDDVLVDQQGEAASALQVCVPVHTPVETLRVGAIVLMMSVPKN